MNDKHVKNENSSLREEKRVRKLAEQRLSFTGLDLVITALLCSHSNSCCSAISVTWPPQPPFYIFKQKSSPTGHPILSLYKTEIALDVMEHWLNILMMSPVHEQRRKHGI